MKPEEEVKGCITIWFQLFLRSAASLLFINVATFRTLKLLETYTEMSDQKLTALISVILFTYLLAVYSMFFRERDFR